MNKRWSVAREGAKAATLKQGGGGGGGGRSLVLPRNTIGRTFAKADDGDRVRDHGVNKATSSTNAEEGGSWLRSVGVNLHDVRRPQTYDVAFNLGTSLVLVPAYMALSLTRRRREGGQGEKGRLIDKLWSPSETKEAPWFGEQRGLRSKWLLNSAIPILLGSIFFFLFGIDKSIFVKVFQCCWTAKIPALQGLLQSPATVVQIWSQITFLDFMVARYVLNESLEKGLPYKHSVILCFLVGPAGLLSHLCTKALCSRNNKRKRNAKEETSL